MAIFDSWRYIATRRHRDVFGRYERIYTLIDFMAAFLFVAGSICFFYPEAMEAGTWMFLVGSLAFAAKPSVRLLREFHLANLPLPGDGKLDAGAPAGD